MTDVKDSSFEENIKAIRQEQAMNVFNSMRKKAAESGYMTDEEIEAEIADTRKKISQVS